MRQEFWTLDHFWNFCYHCVKGGSWQSEDGDATWRIALPWRRYLQAMTAF